MPAMGKGFMGLAAVTIQSWLSWDLPGRTIFAVSRRVRTQNRYSLHSLLRSQQLRPSPYDKCCAPLTSHGSEFSTAYSRCTTGMEVIENAASIRLAARAGWFLDC